jgi:AraC-like DNA-binding protein
LKEPALPDKLVDMSRQYYHLALDLEPLWMSKQGFAMEKLQIEWVQTPNWWLMIVAMYGGIFTVNGTPIPFEPASFLLAPPSARCSLTRLDGEDITHFWYGFRPNPEAAVLRALPQSKALGEDAAYVQRQFREALDTMLISSTRCHAWGWHLLWSLSENVSSTPEDTSTAEIQAFVDQNLSDPDLNSKLNDFLQRSDRHVARLFREHFNQPPAAYLRSRRMHRACELLLTTDLSIKEVAVAVGFLDLHRFNKVVRETFGCAPRTLRSDRRVATINTDAAEAEHRRLALLSAEKRPDVRLR